MYKDGRHDFGSRGDGLLTRFLPYRRAVEMGFGSSMWECCGCSRMLDLGN